MKIRDGKIVYQCGTCSVENVKLWREYNIFLEHQSLYCVDCAIQQGMKSEWRRKYVTQKDENTPVFVFEDGKHVDATGFRTDQLGGLIPAALTIEEDTFWGYCSVPEDRVQWWKNLPLRKA